VTARRRLDAEMVRRGLVSTPEQACAEIAAGRVTVGGAPASTSARLVHSGEAVVVLEPGPRFVSRAGAKLEAAVQRFHLGPELVGRRVLDVGASTGGFTDCVLQNGAAQVVALDVGHNQLHERLRADARVTNLERTNLRTVAPEVVGAPVDVVVGDLSFISLRAVLPTLLALVREGGLFVLLVKPQFEAERAEADRGRGVIADPVVWRRVLGDVVGALLGRGATIMGAMVSPLTGADGNVEFVVIGRAPGPGCDRPVGRWGALDDEELTVVLDTAVAEATAVGHGV
jgi:23S rRNA (cytidine1920-2'-O)/16S rRNA (cytidine1409-2'-O)-methyltransferase